MNKVLSSVAFLALGVANCAWSIRKGDVIWVAFTGFSVGVLLIKALDEAIEYCKSKDEDADNA